MSIFGRNWLEEGFYEDDGYGDLTRIDESNINMFSKKHRKDLYYHDGYSITKLNDSEEDLEIEP